MSLTDQDRWGARKRFVDTPNARIAYVESDGTGHALLLIHGFTDSSRSYSLIEPFLEGHRLVIPDLRFHGGTQAANSRVGVADFADDITGLIEATGLHRPVLVGHSLGAMVAMETAARNPALVGGLCLLAGTLTADIAQDHPVSKGVASLRDPISPQDPFYAYWHDCAESVPREFLSHLAVEASQIPAAFWQAILQTIRHADMSVAAGRLKGVSPLIIGGGRDPLFGDAHQSRLADAFDDASVVRLEDCGHNVHWEEPASVAKALLSHVESVSS